MFKSEVNTISNLLKELYNNYSSEPYYLKETLKKIKSLVHQADLQAEKLIEADWFKDFNANEVLTTLQQEFTNLTWEAGQTDNGYSFTSQLEQLHIRVDYKVSWMSGLVKKDKLEPYWEVDIYLEQSDWIITLSEDRSKLINLEVAIHYIKNTLLPVKKVFDSLQLE